MKSRAELNEIETRKTAEKINETRKWFVEKINKIEKPVSRLRKEEQTQINYQYSWYHRNTRFIRNYYKQLYTNKLDYVEEMDKFWEKYNPP